MLMRSLVAKLATCVENLVAKFYFHLPWRPKWSQIEALVERHILFLKRSVHFRNLNRRNEEIIV